MNIPFITGRNVFLRGITKKDVNKDYLSWINDYDVVKNMTTGLFPTSQEDILEYVDRINKSNSEVIFAIVHKKEEKHIGNIKLGEINWIHRHAYIGIMIGNKDFLGKRLGTEACELILWYAFNRLNLHKVSATLSENNIASKKMFQKLGLNVEGRRIKQSFQEGKYYDVIIMGILEEDYFKQERTIQF